MFCPANPPKASSGGFAISLPLIANPSFFSLTLLVIANTVACPASSGKAIPHLTQFLSPPVIANPAKRSLTLPCSSPSPSSRTPQSDPSPYPVPLPPRHREPRKAIPHLTPFLSLPVIANPAKRSLTSPRSSPSPSSRTLQGDPSPHPVPLPPRHREPRKAIPHLTPFLSLPVIANPAKRSLTSPSSSPSPS